MTQHPLRGNIVRGGFAGNRPLQNPITGHLIEQLIVECGLLAQGKSGA
jgi:hypothetical protein